MEVLMSLCFENVNFRGRCAVFSLFFFALLKNVLLLFI